jgi:hypothetical protein
VELYIQPPNTASGRGAQLNHRDNFTFSSDEDLLVAFQLTKLSPLEDVLHTRKRYDL